jgi:hypothetical protein
MLATFYKKLTIKLMWFFKVEMNQTKAALPKKNNKKLNLFELEFWFITEQRANERSCYVIDEERTFEALNFKISLFSLPKVRFNMQLFYSINKYYRHIERINQIRFFFSK